jgi:hypothetical protein
MGKKRLTPLRKELEPLTRLIENLGHHYEPQRVFFDFVEMSAIALSKLDTRQAAAREERYLSIINQYKTLEERQTFPKMLGELVIALEKTDEDVLGPISASLGMCSYRKGQFWTPWTVSYMMAKIAVCGGPDEGPLGKEELQSEGGFVTMADPCCGPGGMPMAFARAFKEEGHNPQQQLHITAVDISPYSVHMTYCQLALMGLPAIVYLGDSLRNEFTEEWFTPIHILGGFSRRLRQRGFDEKSTAWWVKATMPERIDFLQANNLEVGEAVKPRPGRTVLTAKQQAAGELQETA